MTNQCKRTVANVLMAVSFFLLSRCCCCHANVLEHRVEENNQTTEIVFSSKTKQQTKLSGPILGTEVKIEASNNQTILNDKGAFGIIFNVYIKQLTADTDSVIVTYTDYSTESQNVVDLANTGVFIAKSGGPYLLNFRGLNHIGGRSRIKSLSTSIALLLVNSLVRATSYANPGDGNIASISAVVNLERGDRVHIFVSGAESYKNNATDDDDAFHVQFSGVKLELNK